MYATNEHYQSDGSVPLSSTKIPTTGPGNNLVPYFATKSLAAYSFPTAARKQAFFE